LTTATLHLPSIVIMAPRLPGAVLWLPRPSINPVGATANPAALMVAAPGLRSNVPVSKTFRLPKSRVQPLLIVKVLVIVHGPLPEGHPPGSWAMISSAVHAVSAWAGAAAVMRAPASPHSRGRRVFLRRDTSDSFNARTAPRQSHTV